MSGHRKTWTELVALAQSENSSERKDAILLSAARVEEALRALGFYEMSLPGGEALTLLPLVRALAGSAHAALLPVIRLRNDLAHNPTAQTTVHKAQSAVSGCRDFIKTLATMAASHAEMELTDGGRGESSALKLTDELRRTVQHWGVVTASVETIFDSVAAMHPLARVGLEADVKELGDRTDATGRQCQWLWKECLGAAVRVGLIRELMAQQNLDAAAWALIHACEGSPTRILDDFKFKTWRSRWADLAAQLRSRVDDIGRTSRNIKSSLLFDEKDSE